MTINKFLQDKMNVAVKKAMSRKYKNIIATNFFTFNALGISDEETLEKYHYLSQCVPTLVKKVYGSYDDKLNNTVIKYALKKLNKDFSDKDIVDVVAKCFYDLKLIKISYPNIGGEIEPIKKYDINKWINALNDIYIRTKLYGNKRDAINQATSQWDNMDEKLDFERWARFYEQGGLRLYKSADDMYSKLPIQAIPGLIPRDNSNFANIEKAMDPEEPSEKELKSNKKNISMEELRKRIVSRITSIEKILLDNSQKIPDTQYNKLLNALVEVKREVFNIRTASMLEDIIYREANILEKTGANTNTIKLFMKIAQLPPLGDPGAGGGAAPDPNAAGGGAPTADPTSGAKAAENFIKLLGEISPDAKKIKVSLQEEQKQPTAGAAGATGQQVAATPAQPAAAPTEAPTAQAALDRNSNIKKYNWAVIDTPELQKFEKLANSIYQLISGAKAHIYITAQDVTAPAQPTAIVNPEQEQAADISDTGAKATKKKPEDEPIVPIKSPADASLLNIDEDVMEKALANIKLSDVIKRLQALSRVFKNREIARQLAIIDIMLDKLGISGFFPSLAEATRSALESNQYCQTRIEEVLSKLISATDEKGTSLMEPGISSSEGDGVIDREMKEYTKTPEEGKAETTTEEAPEAAPAEPAPAAPVAPETVTV